MAYSDVETRADTQLDVRVPVQLTASDFGVFHSPDQVDFGVATQRSDRLRRTLTLLNAGSEPVRILDVVARPNDPSLRVRFRRGEVLAPYEETKAISLTYSGRLEGIRGGSLSIRTNASGAPETFEVPYKARVMHGRLAYDEADVSFMSPEHGKRPFPKRSKTVRIANAFPAPLTIHSAKITKVAGDDYDSSPEDACCFKLTNAPFRTTVPAGGAIEPFEVEYEPQSTNAIFTATLALETNLTTLEIPVKVFHGQLTCFDAEQAAFRAAAMADAAAKAAAAVIHGDKESRKEEEAKSPGGSASSKAGGASGSRKSSSLSAEDLRGSALGKEGEGLTVPCGMSDGSKRERNNTRIMGVIDFGVVAVSNERYRRVAVLNPNPTPVTMTSVVSTVRAVRVTRVEVSGAPLDSLISPSVSDAALRVSSVFRPLPPPEGCLTNEGKMAACEQAFVGGGERVAGVIPYGKSPATIPPNHVAVIDVRAAPKKEELAKMGGMLSFSFDNGRSLVAPVVLRALRGDISVVAGGVSGERGDAAGGAVDATLELPPAFPGARRARC